MAGGYFLYTGHFDDKPQWRDATADRFAP